MISHSPQPSYLRVDSVFLGILGSSEAFEGLLVWILFSVIAVNLVYLLPQGTYMMIYAVGGHRKLKTATANGRVPTVFLRFI